jgi:nucleoprotein TPR
MSLSCSILGLTALAERYEMLNGNFNMLKSENQELQKRLTSMHETQARLDLKTQQAAEELVDSKSLFESMRTENANLKAEKAFFKNVEQRMAQDNEALTQDRARLNALVTNLQSMRSEHERNSSEARRSHLAQYEQHRADLQAAERRLNEEMEQSKRSLIRKEMDQKEFQRRYDELNTTYQTVKEELVAAKTSHDYLQTRVNELTIDLKNAEEKLAVYQNKPSAPATNQDEEDTASIEEELRLEVVDFKKQLEVRNTELANSKEQARYYKAISMANEEQLEDLQITADQFRESIEQELEQREVRVFTASVLCMVNFM